jgi:hypothetical protein
MIIDFKTNWRQNVGLWWDEWIFSTYLILPATLSPGFTQFLIEIGTRNRKIMFLRSALPPAVSRLSIQCLFLNISQSYRPLLPVTGIALLYFLNGMYYERGEQITPWSEAASELYRPSDRRLSTKRLPTFADRRCHVVSVTDPYGRIVGFLDSSGYFSIK